MKPEVAGRVMIAVAAVGVLVGISATIVGWRLAGHLFDGVDDSLAVATQSLESVDESITVIETLVVDVRDGVGTLDRTIADVSVASETTIGAMQELTAEAPQLADGVESLRANAADLSEAGTTIDRTLESIDDLPGVPDYDPRRPIGETIGGLADDLDAIATTLRSVDAGAKDIDATLAPLLADLADARADLAELDRSLENSESLLEQYRASAAEASGIAVRTRGDLSDDLRATRVLIVLGGLVFTIGQIVPYWLGRTVLLEVAAARRRAEAEVEPAEHAPSTPPI
jgi:methyl-accepting chemotaxis protein